VVFPPLQVWDPDGDKVTIEGYGLPPLRRELKRLPGFPGGLTDEDLCTAAVGGEAFWRSSR